VVYINILMDFIKIHQVFLIILTVHSQNQIVDSKNLLVFLQINLELIENQIGLFGNQIDFNKFLTVALLIRLFCIEILLLFVVYNK